MYLDGNRGLLILVGGEHLRLLGGDDGVPRDQLGHDSTNGLNTHRKRSHVQEKDVCNKGQITLVSIG
jgi:hypothetical protein